MVRGYQIGKIKEKLIDTLRDSKTGLSGIEIAEKIGVNRITMAKYLNILSAEGLVRQKKVGSVTLWFMQEGVDKLSFPADIYQVKNRYMQYLLTGSHKEAYNLLRNSIYSGADQKKLITEVIVSAIETVQDSFEKGKTGKSEKNFYDGIISSSIQLFTLSEVEIDSKKNAVIFSADANGLLLSQAASAAFHIGGWKVSQLGDMSSAIDVMFDIDLQKLLNKVWDRRQGLMVIIVFSSTENGLKFFSEAVNSIKIKFGKSLRLALCTKLAKKTKAKADFVTENLETALQWCQTVYETSQL